MTIQLIVLEEYLLLDCLPFATELYRSVRLH